MDTLSDILYTHTVRRKRAGRALPTLPAVLVTATHLRTVRVTPVRMQTPRPLAWTLC